MINFNSRLIDEIILRLSGHHLEPAYWLCIANSIPEGLRGAASRAPYELNDGIHRVSIDNEREHQIHEPPT